MAQLRHILILLPLLILNLYGSGKVIEQSQPAQILRGEAKLLTEVDSSVKMYDEIETLNGTIKIVFEDGTKVSLSKYSKLQVDEYVYDSNKKTGKLSLKGKLGTLRYSSGLIAKNNKKNVKISSPTANVSVRGTDFTMTVEHTGKTTFQLLPSIDASGNAYTGSISVSNSSGVVVLNQAFEVTRVETSFTPPTPPNTEVRQAPREKKDDLKDNDGSDPEDNNNRDKAPNKNGEETANNNKQVEAFVLFQTNPYDMNKVLFNKTTEQGNVTSLNIDASSDTTINYINNGIFESFNLNSGSGVIFNIEQ
ncbi:FecR family protein [bacterium]|nr:FecR family protein [bacterium]